LAENEYILLAGLEERAATQANDFLTELGHRIVTVDGISDPREFLTEPGLGVVYLQPPSGSDGITELRKIVEACPGVPVVLITTGATASGTLDAFHAGAADVLLLPLAKPSLKASLDRAMKYARRKPDSTSLARLRYLDEAGKECWAAIIPPRFTIGRSSNNDLVLTQMNVSRMQAEILIENNEHRIRDLGSKHGTYVNGIRMEEAKLVHGDRIQVGGLHGSNVTFHQGDLLQSLLGLSESKSEAGLSVRGFREIGLLLETFRALSSIPLLDDVLALVVDTAIELTGAERGFIMLKDSNSQLQFRCARNSFKQPLDGSYFQTSRRVPEEVFNNAQPMVINDLDIGAGGEDHAVTRRLGVRSISCVPLRYFAFHESGSLSGMRLMETLGVLYVDSQNVAARLSDTQLKALETLASEAAMAIYNARLYKESQEKRRLDQELAIAREIQQALLPPSNKILPYACAYSENIPCHEVGGDYFDYFDFDDGRLGFALGDVAGKGMSAALLTSVLQGIFSTQTLLNLPPPAILSNVNRNLARRSTGNRFVTLFFGILDPQGLLTYSNAGHNPPILLGPDGSIRELTEGGIVLGIFDDADYESATVELKRGDHLVLFTDGVLEARDTKGDEFGEQRLHTLLQENARRSASDILARLRDAIALFSAGTPQHDDITMMILGYQEAEKQSQVGSVGVLAS
jgi:sigma-B regulation protein RsbU (phosphoserine phosphatase)